MPLTMKQMANEGSFSPRVSKLSSREMKKKDKM